MDNTFTQDESKLAQKEMAPPKKVSASEPLLSGQEGPPPQRKTVAITLTAIAVLLLGLCVWGLVSLYGGKPTTNGKDKSVPINVATAGTKLVPIEIRSIGNVMPYSVVNVVPQVGGQLKKVYFTQGQLVKQGDLLFEIDPRPFQAAYDQAMGNVAKDVALVESAQANYAKDEANKGLMEANLAKDQASAKYAHTENNRYSDLVNEGAVSHEQSDQMSTNATTADDTIQADKMAIVNAEAVMKGDTAAIATARGTLKADQAVADNAKIQLGWTQIRSPIDGRTSSLNIYQGNVVSANGTTPLVTIDQIKPIYVTMTVPEQYLNDIRRSQAAGTLHVEALIEGVKTDEVNGAISFLENTVNTGTGTITMRATLPNVDSHLYPGQFVDVKITMPPAGASVVVPARAVQTTQQGTSVYVVRDGKAMLTPVDMQRTFGDSAAIGKGLQAGDVVVTDGQMQLSPGAPVKIEKDIDTPSGK